MLRFFRGAAKIPQVLGHGFAPGSIVNGPSVQDLARLVERNEN